MVWLEDTFHVWTPHGLAKKKFKWLKSQSKPREGVGVEGASPSIDKFVKNIILWCIGK